MESILVQKNRINLNFETQISKNGRPFRLSGISIVSDKPAIWIEKRLTHGTIYHFRYLDKQDEFFAFEFDPKGLFRTIINNHSL
jgi:hypothetical protein